MIEPEMNTVKPVLWGIMLNVILVYILLAPLQVVHAATPLDRVISNKISKQAPVYGDFPQILERRIIRALVPPSKTFYFLDGGRPKGASYDGLKQFEKILNQNLSNKVLKVHVIVIPTPRDGLIEGLGQGLGDIAIGNLTITGERKKQVDFSVPVFSGVTEILVTHKNSTKIGSMEDLAGKTVYVRPSSSYFASLERLNTVFLKRGIPVINIVSVSDYLENEDLLEMVNAGLIPRTIVDSHIAKFWAQIFKKIELHHDIRFRENAKIAWAVRKNCPAFMAVINDFVKDHRKGSLFGNILLKRYLKSTKYVRQHYTGKDKKRFESASRFFKKYGDKYEFDWLMLAALAYQESRINQNVVSQAGAVGIMQILPSTAKGSPINIPDISTINENIHAGTKYLRYIIDRYFNDPKIDILNKTLLGFASYNAGPNRIAKLRQRAADAGLDPFIWFNNVELMAARYIGRETVNYVNNIFKYYVAYHFIIHKDITNPLD